MGKMAIPRKKYNQMLLDIIQNAPANPIEKILKVSQFMSAFTSDQPEDPQKDYDDERCNDWTR